VTEAGTTFPANAASLTVEARIPLGSVKGRIDHLAIDLDGGRLFVAELGNDTVDVVDLRAGKVVQRISGLAEPQGVGWEPKTRTLWVANARDGSLRVFDGTTLEPVGRIDLGDDADNVRIAAGQVFVGYGNGALAVIDPASRKVTVTVPLAGHPEGFQIDAASNRAVVNVPDKREIAVLDLNSGKQTASRLTGPYRANFPMALLPDAGTAAIARRPAALLRYDTRGELAWARPTCGDADDVFFDPARRRFYVSCGDGKVEVQADQRDGSDEPVKTAQGARTSFYSPEFDRLYVAAPARDGPAEIIVLKPLTQ
jgi:hypothetical protein